MSYRQTCPNCNKETLDPHAGQCLECGYYPGVSRQPGQAGRPAPKETPRPELQPYVVMGTNPDHSLNCSMVAVACTCGSRLFREIERGRLQCSQGHRHSFDPRRLRSAW